MLFLSRRAAREFKALVHAPALRTGARLCICDLRQTRSAPPGAVRAGSSLRLQYGACCPDWGDATVTDVHGDEATIVADGTEWHLRRCGESPVAFESGIQAEDWFVC